AQFLFALFALGDVADRTDEPYRPALVVAHRHRMVLDPAIVATAEADAVLAEETRRLAFQRGAQCRAVAREIVGMDAGIPILAGTLAGAGPGVAPGEQLDQPLRHPEPVFVDIPVVDALGRRLGDQRIALVARAQRPLAPRQLVGAPTQFVEQPRILHRDDRLRPEILQ